MGIVVGVGVGAGVVATGVGVDAGPADWEASSAPPHADSRHTSTGTVRYEATGEAFSMFRLFIRVFMNLVPGHCLPLALLHSARILHSSAQRGASM